MTSISGSGGVINGGPRIQCNVSGGRSRGSTDRNEAESGSNRNRLERRTETARLTLRSPALFSGRPIRLQQGGGSGR